MNSSSMSVESAVTVTRIQSTEETRYRRRISQETLVAIAFGVLTSGLMGVLYYSLYYALHQYRVF